MAFLFPLLWALSFLWYNSTYPSRYGTECLKGKVMTDILYHQRIFYIAKTNAKLYVRIYTYPALRIIYHIYLEVNRIFRSKKKKASKISYGDIPVSGDAIFRNPVSKELDSFISQLKTNFTNGKRRVLFFPDWVLWTRGSLYIWEIYIPK